MGKDEDIRNALSILNREATLIKGNWYFTDNPIPFPTRRIWSRSPSPTLSIMEMEQREEERKMAAVEPRKPSWPPTPEAEQEVMEVSPPEDKKQPKALKTKRKGISATQEVGSRRSERGLVKIKRFAFEEDDNRDDQKRQDSTRPGEGKAGPTIAKGKKQTKITKKLPLSRPQESVESYDHDIYSSSEGARGYHPQASRMHMIAYLR